MKTRLQMVQFGVAGLSDIRTLLSRWRAVLAGLAEAAGPSLVMQTYHQVGVEVEHRRPGEEVLLTFLAPPEVLRRFQADLRAQGLAVQEDHLIPGFLTTCRLLPGQRH